MNPTRSLRCSLALMALALAARTNDSGIEAGKELVRRAHAEVWSRGDLAAADRLYASNFVCHFIGGIEWKGRDALKAEVQRHRTSFPDWTEQVEQVVAEGDLVVTRFTSTGTQLGPFNGRPATGRKVRIPELAVHRIANGLIVEQWGAPDVLSLEQQLGAATPATDAADNLALIRRYFAEWANRGDARVADELIATNLVLHNPPAVLNSLEDYKRSLTAFHQAFPDLRFQIDDLVAGGDKVVARWTLTGTHRGEFQGRPPTGNAVRVTGTSTFRISTGRIREIWVDMDRLGLMTQLGWLPSTPPK